MLGAPKPFTEAVLLAQKYGWRMSPHADGDDSLDAILDAFEAADRVSSIKDKRWVIEHVPLATPEQIRRMVRLGRGDFVAIRRLGAEPGRRHRRGGPSARRAAAAGPRTASMRASSSAPAATSSGPP
jgi:hypothetical protein